MPGPSKVRPSAVRNFSLGRPKVQPLGRVRPRASENTPCVLSPMRSGAGERPIRAWVKVSPALIVRRPVRTATGPVWTGPGCGLIRLGCGVVNRAGTHAREPLVLAGYHSGVGVVQRLDHRAEHREEFVIGGPRRDPRPEAVADSRPVDPLGTEEGVVLGVGLPEDVEDRPWIAGRAPGAAVGEGIDAIQGAPADDVLDDQPGVAGAGRCHGDRGRAPDREAEAAVRSGRAGAGARHGAGQAADAGGLVLRMLRPLRVTRVP